MINSAYPDETANRVSGKTFNHRMVNSADPDETGRSEPFHLDLRCLQRYMYLSAGIKELRKRFVCRDKRVKEMMNCCRRCCKYLKCSTINVRILSTRKKYVQSESIC